jgi:hypothetical protein
MQLSEIKLSLQSIEQILLAPETSGYRRRMLNQNVEEFIVEEAQTCPRQNAFALTIKLPVIEIARAREVEAAIRGHFGYLRKKSEEKFKRTLQLGWRSLLIGFAFLVLVFVLTEIGDGIIPEGGVAMTIRESLIILGWVAMWRPADLLLYEWYPFKRDAKLFDKLAKSKVRVVSESEQHGTH